MEDLFTYASHNYTDTSKEAYQKKTPKLKGLRRLVFDYLKEQPACNEKIAEDLNMTLSSVCARCRELQVLGLVKDSGKRTLTKYKRTAILWETTNLKTLSDI
jgi:predicted transcriptional regulator